MKNKDRTHRYMGYIIGSITMVLIGFFLSGKIIDIPNGTHKGGIIAAFGVIIITMTIIGFFVRLYIDRIKKNNLNR